MNYYEILLKMNIKQYIDANGNLIDLLDGKEDINDKYIRDTQIPNEMY